MSQRMDAEITELYNEGMRASVRALIFQFLFYGAYISLGVAYVSLQVKQHRLQDQKKFQHPFYPVTLVMLFILATAGLIVSVYDVENVIKEIMSVAASATGEELLPRAQLTVNYRTAIGTIYCFANWIADVVLIYRCYHVWHRRALIIIFPSVLSVINASISLASLALIKVGSDELISTGVSTKVTTGDRLNNAFLGLNAFENVLLTALIAGRIWWLNKVHGRLLGTSGSDKRLGAIVTMFVESGSIYPVALIICLIIELKGTTATMDPILLQIVGFVPTLIMVRTSIGLGKEITPNEEVTELDEVNFKKSFTNRYAGDVKDTCTPKTTGPYLPSSVHSNLDYTAPPLSSMTSLAGGDGSTYHDMGSYNRLRSTMATTVTGQTTMESAPAYDNHRETNGSGFQPKMMFRHNSSQSQSPVALPLMATSTIVSETGTGDDTLSLSLRNQDDKLLRPLRNPAQG